MGIAHPALSVAVNAFLFGGTFLSKPATEKDPRKLKWEKEQRRKAIKKVVSMIDFYALR